jgi:hypothetical protein
MDFSIYTPHEDANGNITEVRTTVPITCNPDHFEDLYLEVIAEAEDKFGIALDAYGDDFTVEYEIADSDWTSAIPVLQQLVDDVVAFVRSKIGF